MTSKEKYETLGDKDKKLISVLLAKGKTQQYIAERFGLSKKFVRCHLYNEFGIKFINYNSIPIFFGTKKESYYENEMDYGTLNLSYHFKDLNEFEIIAYNNYNEKNKAYYDI